MSGTFVLFFVNSCLSKLKIHVYYIAINRQCFRNSLVIDSTLFLPTTLDISYNQLYSVVDFFFFLKNG